MWLEIAANWNCKSTIPGDVLHVRFDIRPRTSAVRIDEFDILRVARGFFLNLMGEFLRAHGSIHLHVQTTYGNHAAWPRRVTTEKELTNALDSLLASQEASPYPIVAWIEPKKLRRFRPFNEEDLIAAASDMSILDEVVQAGVARFFLDEEWGDLLASGRDHGWICEWIREAVRVSSGVVLVSD